MTAASSFNWAKQSGTMKPKELARFIKLHAQFRLELDRDGIDKAVRNMNRRALRAAGAASRAIMIKSMKDVSDPPRGSLNSKPGNPPFAHRRAGRKLKRLITFQLEDDKDGPHTVVIGPTLTNSTSRVPRIMEFGGTVDLIGRKWLTPSGKVYQRNGRKLRSSPVNQQVAERRMQHIKDYYSKLQKVEVKISGVQIVARPYARPVYRKLVAKGAARWWFNQLRAVR